MMDAARVRHPRRVPPERLGVVPDGLLGDGQGPEPQEAHTGERDRSTARDGGQALKDSATQDRASQRREVVVAVGRELWLGRRPGVHRHQEDHA